MSPNSARGLKVLLSPLVGTVLTDPPMHFNSSSPATAAADTNNTPQSRRMGTPVEGTGGVGLRVLLYADHPRTGARGGRMLRIQITAGPGDVQRRSAWGSDGTGAAPRPAHLAFGVD